MQLELENLKTQEMVVVDPSGKIFGRAGSSADIQLRDQAVSKKHARVYETGGTWYLEDLGSSNGTYVDRKKIDTPIPLSEGMVFALSRFKFRVARITGNGVSAKAAHNGAAAADEPLFDQDSDDQEPPQSSPSRSAPRSAPEPVSAAVPSLPVGVGEAAHTAPPDDLDDDGASLPPGGDDVKSITPGYFMVAVPKAVAQYMVWVPALAVAPWVVIPKGVKEQKHQAMGKLELAAYAMPALFITSAFGSVCGALAAMIGGAGFGAALGTAVGGLIAAAIVGVVGGIVTGLFGDRILEWLINLLKGESDPRARTNYMLAAFTASILVAVPNGLGTILGGIPFAQILAPVLLTAGSLITAFLAFTWFKYFRVHHVVPKVFLALGALAALGGLVGVVGKTIDSIKWLTSDSPSVAAPDVPDVEEPEKDDPEPVAAKDDDSEPAKDDDEKVAKDDPDAKDLKAEDDKAEKGGEEEVAAKGKDKKGKDKKGKDKKGKDDDKGAGGEKVAAATTDVVEEPAGPPPDIDFDDYADLVTDVDELIAENPLVLEMPGAKDLYRKISAARYEARKRYEAAMASTPQHELVHEADRQAAVYRATATWLKELYKIID